jgi:plastocyanin
MRRLLQLTGVGAVIAAALALAPVAAATPSKVLASDACSPSFNVLFMDPTICNRKGGMPVGVFLQQLERNKTAGAWHFSPPHQKIDAGHRLTIVNRGGETHTFTQVSQFGGGGIVPALNQILFGTPNPPLFFNPNNVTFIPAGGEETHTFRTPGKYLFICAIHPWMEDTVVVR